MCRCRPPVRALRSAFVLATHLNQVVLSRACLNFGFLYLTGFESVLPEAEMHAPLDVSRTFFQRPAEEKAKIRIQQPDGARGYQVLGENVTLYAGARPPPPQRASPQKQLTSVVSPPSRPPRGSRFVQACRA